MTGDQSRLLKVDDRVRWGATTTDLGTVVETTWNGVTIDWDDGNRTSIQHNGQNKWLDSLGSFLYFSSGWTALRELKNR
jgi:hypothetical protein